MRADYSADHVTTHYRRNADGTRTPVEPTDLAPMVFAKPDDLREFIVALDVSWRNYALADPETLTPAAQRWREKLLEVAEGIGYPLGGWA